MFNDEKGKNSIKEFTVRGLLTYPVLRISQGIFNNRTISIASYHSTCLFVIRHISM